MANTNSGSKLFICTSPQNADLTQAQYEALAWVQVRGVGSHGETGNQQNIVSMDTWDILFQDKGKGIANAGDPDVEIAPIPGDAGQAAMRVAAAAGNPNKYAFKIERNDAPVGGSPTIVFNRGVVTGPRNTNGRNEDFNLDIYTIGCVQEQITVQASSLTLSGNLPAVVKNTAFSFTPTVTGADGAVTYTWNGTNLAVAALTLNASTGLLSATSLTGGAVVNGTITAVDAAGKRGVYHVSFTVPA